MTEIKLSNKKIDANYIIAEQLEDIARGAALLGTGGGGDPYIGRLLALSAINEFGPPMLINASELKDDATVLTIAMVGAPAVITEKGSSGFEIDLAIQKMEEKLGKKADAIIPIEIGGLNSMIPILAAARTKLPLVDADGMGRAFPEIQMVTFNIFGVPCTPAVITDEHLNVLTLETHNAKRAEDLVRVSSIEMGCSVIMSSYSMTGKQAKNFAVHGTMSMALEIGKAIRLGRINGDPFTSLIDYLSSNQYYNYCKVIFDGKVADIKRETKQGFNVGHCFLDALDGSQDRMEVLFQNEHLVAKLNGHVKTIVPDLICIVDRESCEPITVEALKYGQRVKVIGMSAAPIMRTQAALDVFGPQAFSLDEPFTPIEKL